MKSMVNNYKHAVSVDRKFNKLLKNKKFQMASANLRLNKLDHTEIEELYNQYIIGE